MRRHSLAGSEAGIEPITVATTRDAMTARRFDWRAATRRGRDASVDATFFARMLRNAGHLAGGNLSAAGLGVVTLAVMAHMLGPALLGVIVMVEAYGRLVDQVLRLETWQTIVRYGAGALEEGKRDQFARLVKLGVVTDLAGAALAAAAAVLGAGLAATLLGWDGETTAMARLYGATLVLGVSSTPTGVLRLFDRFAEIAWIPTLIAAIRLAGVLVLWTLGASIWALLILSIVLRASEHAALCALAWRTLGAQGHRGVVAAPVRGVTAAFPGLLTFLFAANGTVLIRKSTQEIDVLVVGGVTGAAGAGIYQFARKFALSVVKAGALLQQAAFPDLARLWVRRETRIFLATIARIELATMVLAVAMVATIALAGDRIIALVAGPDFEDAYAPLLIHAFAALLFLSGSAIRPALMATGHQLQMLYIAAGAALGFYVALFVAVPALGAVGGSVAHLVFNGLWLPASALLFAAVVRKGPGSPAYPSSARD